MLRPRGLEKLYPDIVPQNECGLNHTEKDSHKILHVRLVAEIVANNDELHVFGIRFRYWLPVSSSTPIIHTHNKVQRDPAQNTKNKYAYKVKSSF
jgi:uncharacterized protein (DUF2126 family)